MNPQKNTRIKGVRIRREPNSQDNSDNSNKYSQIGQSKYNEALKQGVIERIFLSEQLS